MKIEGLADLLDPAVKKIAIANPAVAPYGAAARQALERAKVWETVNDRQRKVVKAMVEIG